MRNGVRVAEYSEPCGSGPIDCGGSTDCAVGVAAADGGKQQLQPNLETTWMRSWRSNDPGH